MGKSDIKLNWDDLKLVKAVVEAGGHPALAAELAGVDPSTIFRRLKRLEQALGVVLFERHPAGHKPTEAGAELAALAERVHGDLGTVTRKLAVRASAPAGELNVTTNDSILVHLLTPSITAFRERYPGVRLNLLVDNSSLNLARRDADVALRATEKPPENLVGRRLSRIAWALYGHAGMQAPAPGEAVGWVAFGGNLSRLKVARFVEAHVAAAQIACTVNSVQALADAIEAGVGVGLLPCFVGEQRPALVRLAPPIPELAADLWLLTHPDLKRSPRVRAFVDHVVPALLGKRHLLEGSGDVPR